MFHNPDLTAEQANQLDYLLSQNALNPQIDSNQFNYISQYLTRLDQIWSSTDLTARIDSNIRQAQAYLDLNLSRTNSVFWYFDNALTAPKMNRKNLVKRLEETLKELKTLNLNEFIEKLTASEQTILKRLEWAASSQPGLVDTVKAFESERRLNSSYYKSRAEGCSELVKLVDGWLGMELSRDKDWTVGVEIREVFEDVLQRFKSLLTMDMADVTEVEKSLMCFEGFGEKMPLSGSIVQEYYKRLFEEVSNIKRSKQREEKECNAKIVRIGVYFRY